MQITVDIQSNKQYSSHHGRQSYQLIITWCNVMLPFCSMSNVIYCERCTKKRVHVL